MQRGKYLLLLWLILLPVLICNACTKVHEAERAAAQAAMDAAIAAGAEKYAPADFAAARNLWDAAEALVSEKRYEEAKNAYPAATAAFAKATGVVVGAKAVLTEEVKASVAGLEEEWKSLERLSNQMEKKMTQGKKVWEFDAKTFVEGLQTTKDMLATDPAGAKEKIVQLKSFLTNYTALFQKLAAAPASPDAGRRQAGRSSGGE